MAACLFCRIVAKEIPSRIVYEDDQAVAFEDINPQAPTHLLIVPKRHLDSLLDVESRDAALVGHLIQVVNNLATEHRIAQAGYRTVINCGAQGGQTIDHLHLHLLGGRFMAWPPG